MISYFKCVSVIKPNLNKVCISVNTPHKELHKETKTMHQTLTIINGQAHYYSIEQ